MLLRIQIFPTCSSRGFEKRWRETFAICSKKIIGLLYTKYQRQIESIDIDIQNLLVQVSLYKSASNFPEQDKELQDCSHTKN